MRDLTKGPLPGHLLAMALPMAVGMVVQTLYFLVDLYFVSRIGSVAIAGVGTAGNVMFLILAMTQVLNVGTTSLVSHAVGRGDREGANLVFNQAVVLAGLLTVITLLAGYAGLADLYLSSIGADAPTVAAGAAYLRWFILAMAMQFVMVAMGSALRGTGIVKPTMIVQLLTVVVNIILTPMLVAGWGIGHPLGVAGAGLASAIATLVGVALMIFYFFHLESYVGFRPGLWRPRIEVIRRMLAVGLPAGGEFALMFVYLAVVYTVIRNFGATAQAGFGIGMRVMQSVFLPAMAIAFSVPAVAGQNFGARDAERVRGTFRTAAFMNTTIMLAIMVLVRWRPGALCAPFSGDPAVLEVASVFMSIVSWNFVASGLIFTCSGMFQAMGNTLPSLFSTASRLATFVVPAIWLSSRSGFRIEQVWYLSVTTVWLQVLISLGLVALQFRRRLRFPPGSPAVTAEPAPAGGLPHAAPASPAPPTADEPAS